MHSHLADGVIGNTSDFGSEESRFDPWSASKSLLKHKEAFLFYIHLMAKISSGILLFHIKKGQLMFFLVHPGGPFWSNKAAGAWTIPKGEAAAGEDLLLNAKRELKEETGITVDGDFIDLGSAKLKSGKTIYAFAIEYAEAINEIISNNFEMEWPPKSGKMQLFPEVDKGTFFDMAAAKEKINPAQVIFLERLQQHLEL